MQYEFTLLSKPKRRRPIQNLLLSLALKRFNFEVNPDCLQILSIFSVSLFYIQIKPTTITNKNILSHAYVSKTRSWYYANIVQIKITNQNI